MFVTVSEDVESGSSIQFLDDGINGHWTQGSHLTVIEGPTLNFVVAASGCEAADQRQPALLTVNFGNGQVLTMNLPWISPVVFALLLMPCG